MPFGDRTRVNCWGNQGVWVGGDLAVISIRMQMMMIVSFVGVPEGRK